MAYYLIATDEFGLEFGPAYWANVHGWSGIEEASVFTEHDIRSGVQLPTMGYWLRITPEGISRHDYDSRPKA